MTPQSGVTYPNPTIVEAVCEIQFQLPADRPWKATYPGELFKAIYQEYPEMEPAVDMGFELQFGPHGVQHRVLSPRQRTRYKHASRPLQIQLAENTFTVNALRPYPGWPQLQQDLEKAWGQAKAILNPQAITRVGLRYINRIERRTPDEPPGEWLKAGRFIPAGVLNSKPGFLARVEVRLDEFNQLIVTLGDEPPSADGGIGAVIFDIDRFSVRALSLDDSELRAEIERLHNDVWEVFSEGVSARLERRLRGEEV